jgi:hypothetical protein
VQALSAKISDLVAWNVSLSGTLILIFAVVGILLTVVLWFELLLRNAAIAVLVATSPIAAAGQVSRTTERWWPKLAASTAQLIILKPVIALVFCLGFSLTGRSGDVETLLSGMLVLVLAVLAWPAVARFFTFASVQVGGGAGLAAMLGFAAARATAGPSAPAGTEPDEFSRRLEARTMAGLENAAVRAGTSVTAATGIGRTAALGPAGLAVAATSAAQRAANALTGRMEQMAGHAGLPGANPYAQPAGTPRYPGHQNREPSAPEQPEQPEVPPGPAPGTGPFGPHVPPGPPPGDTPPDGGSPAPQSPPLPHVPPSAPAPVPPTAQSPGPTSEPPEPPEAAPSPSSAPPPPEVHHEPPATGTGGGPGTTDRGPE